MTGIVMFLAALFMLAIGFSVAFTFGAIAVIFGLIGGMVESFGDGNGFVGGLEIFKETFNFMPYRIYSIMENKILIAVPLFVFMGIMSLPVMLKYNYNKALGCGTICASGTLGQIIPPSIVLIILGDVFTVPVGDLFREAIYPGLALVGAYIAYILIISYVKKDYAPPVVVESDVPKSKQILNAILAILPPLVLVVLVLGSIFEGIATPTESSAFGCVGAILLSVFYKTFSFKMLKEALEESVKTTAVVFTILIGATAFSMVFSYTGGDEIVEEVMSSLPGEKWGFIILAMITIFALGFFIDFVEISYIVLPILAPIAVNLGINPLYFAIVIAMNLQTSFLTPPFGFSLFYLKGVAPAEVKTSDIYRGVVPFIAIQILVLIIFTIILLG